MTLDCSDERPPLDRIAFSQSLLPERRYIEMQEPQDGWRFLARTESPEQPFAAFRNDAIVFDREQPWEPFVAHYALHRTLRLQRNLMVFHASAVSASGKGIMLSGPKNSGKTTLSLALAALECDFFGDEFAAVRRDSGELIPFRRSVSIRQGTMSAGIRALLESQHCSPEPYPDGPRYRLPASRLLGKQMQAMAAPLRAIFFLRSIRDSVKIEPFTPGLEHIRLLSPLGSTVAESSPGQTISDFLKLLRRGRCYFLDPGPSPEDTAAAILKAVEEV